MGMGIGGGCTYHGLGKLQTQVPQCAHTDDAQQCALLQLAVLDCPVDGCARTHAAPHPSAVLRAPSPPLLPLHHQLRDAQWGRLHKREGLGQHGSKLSVYQHVFRKGAWLGDSQQAAQVPAELRPVGIAVRAALWTKLSMC